MSLRNQGRADGGGWLEHARLGFNYRIDDIRAALGIGQLEKLDTILALRRSAAQRYADLLGEIEGLELPLADDAEHERSWFVYVVTLARGVDRERVIAELDRQGIATSRYLPSIHLQAYMRERYGFSEGLCPVSEDLSQRTLALPFFTAIEAEDQERVARGARGRAGSRRGTRCLGPDRRSRRVATLVTYSRLPPEQLYNVDESGDLAGGLARTLVVLNYPHALAAIALAAVAGGPRILVWIVDRALRAHRGPGRRRPGRPRRALGQRAACARRGARARPDGRGRAPGRGRVRAAGRGDRLRIVLAAAVLVVALPWLAAETGFYFPADVFLGEEVPAVRVTRASPQSTSASTTVSAASFWR